MQDTATNEEGRRNRQDIIGKKNEGGRKRGE